MGKSVYSLILNDEVIKKIDALAYTMRTSRSNYY
jgi:predicted transcriptional regulator